MDSRSHQLHECKCCLVFGNIILFCRNESEFVVGSRNGNVALWQSKEIKKSSKIFDEWTLVHANSDCIFAASSNKDVVELDMNLDVVKKFKGRDSQPYTVDANQDYLVIGYASGSIDVHSRKDLDQNGTHEKIVVRK